MTDIYQFLDGHNIDYQRFDHPPVFTVADVHRLTPDLPGAKTKNLFLCDQKKRYHFLVMVSHDKRVDLKALSGLLEVGKLRFGSAKRLKQCLGIAPGAVSLLAILNDTDHLVSVVMDQALWTSKSFQFHPLVNTATLTISRENIERFTEKTGHTIKRVDVPGLL
jgi:Ala-tRNA(Pro) deacylase